MLLSRLNENDASLTSSSQAKGSRKREAEEIRVSKELQEVVRRWEKHRVPNTDKRRLVQKLVYLTTIWTGTDKNHKSQMRSHKSQMRMVRMGILDQMQKDLGGNLLKKKLPIKEIDQFIYNGFIVELLSPTC